MKVPEPARRQHDAEDSGDGQWSLRDLVYESPSGPVGRTAALAMRPRHVATRPSPANSIVELAISVSGVLLSIFMLMHMALLASVLFGASTMDDLARFLEDYYLLQTVAPVIIILIVLHVVLAARKAPTTFQQQGVLFRQMSLMKHFDTWTWGFQVVSGVALMALAAIHLWVILTGLPIEAFKSGERVNGVYLWFYIPFIFLIEGHIAMGLYRVAVKWGLLPRTKAHLLFTGWSAVFLGLGYTVLVTFYGLGG